MYMRSYGETEDRMHDLRVIYVNFSNFNMSGEFVHTGGAEAHSLAHSAQKIYSTCLADRQLLFYNPKWVFMTSVTKYEVSYQKSGVHQFSSFEDRGVGDGNIRDDDIYGRYHKALIMSGASVVVQVVDDGGQSMKILNKVHIDDATSKAERIQDFYWSRLVPASALKALRHFLAPVAVRLNHLPGDWVPVNAETSERLTTDTILNYTVITTKNTRRSTQDAPNGTLIEDRLITGQVILYGATGGPEPAADALKDSSIATSLQWFPCHCLMARPRASRAPSSPPATLSFRVIDPNPTALVPQ
ncbi:hypothetical protein F5888DRAFT_1893086 [Russula emetica]|nr:hypothetical protein F5888DRAFT_1893086 [Russula emetica]